MKTIDEIKTAIKLEMAKSDQPYWDSLVSINLKRAQSEFGEEAKNDLIDEFGLEKLGWRKDDTKIKRNKDLNLS